MDSEFEEIKEEYPLEIESQTILIEESKKHDIYKKAKKSDCHWKCPECGEIYRTIGMLKELPEE